MIRQVLTLFVNSLKTIREFSQWLRTKRIHWLKNRLRRKKQKIKQQKKRK